MPNIGAVLREEITRLSRKESKGQLNSTKKAAAQHRRDIASLKRQVALLSRQVALLSRRSLAGSSAAKTDASARRVRFAAKGVRAHRNRLGLSAADFGKLLGISAQSIYNWERGIAKPRAEQIRKLVALRSIGKREAAQRLQSAGAAKKAPAKKKS